MSDTTEYINYGAYNRQQRNVNPLLDNKFTFSVVKLPETSWNCVSAGIPGTSIDIAWQNTRFNKIPYNATTVTYEPLEVTFIVDEDLDNYTEISNWIRMMAMPVTASGYGQLKMQHLQPGPDGGLVSDAQLVILSNTSVPNKVCLFRDAFPISLSAVKFSNDTDNPNTQVATVTFAYTWYDLESLVFPAAAFNYYIDPFNGNDNSPGTTMSTAWKTTTRSNSVTLTGTQRIGYLLNGIWVLYRELGMTVDVASLTADLTDTPSSSF